LATRTNSRLFAPSYLSKIWQKALEIKGMGLKYKGCSVHFTDLSISKGYQNANHNGHPSQPTELKIEAIAQVPTGPTGLSVYVDSCETSEHIVMGHETQRGEGAMGSELAKWETNWNSLNQK
jgi:hypothetical protein